ncbi:MAG: type II secretion system protein [Pseudomonadota bacterium]
MMPFYKSSSAANGQRGFSLLELLVVMFILALAVSVAAPRLSSAIERTGEDRLVQKFQLLLSDARRQARRQNSETAVYLDVQSGAFGLLPDREVGQFDEAWELSATGARSEMLNDETVVFRFWPNGSSSGGEIEIRAETKATRFTVDWMTGLAKVEELE